MADKDLPKNQTPPALTPDPVTGEKVVQRVRESGKANGKKEVSISELLDEIVYDAIVSKASDVHIEPRETEVRVRYRVDGMLRDVLKLEKTYEEPLLFKIKVAAKLPTDEHFAPQDGKIRFIFDNLVIDTRISILPTTKGEKVVIRLLASKGKDFALEDLGLKDKDLEQVKRAYQKPYGTILTVGPTGSGKTTTLYTILRILNSDEINITTIEDPVEYEIPGVNHIHINPKADLTFSSGLRAILRQDPNIIMVGEIRDDETAKIAMNAAMTGHLVLSTLHTNDAVTTVPRLLEMGVERFMIATTVNVIIAQRLARRLCETCKKAYTLPNEQMAELKTIRPDIAANLRGGEKLFMAVGCNQCTSSGYKGRVGLYEVLLITKDVRDAIATGKETDEIFAIAKKQGMNTIVEDGVKKLREGMVDIKELLRVTAMKE